MAAKPKGLRRADVEALEERINGKSNRQIAREKGVSDTTIKRRIAKAEVVLGPKFIEEVKNRLAGLATKGICGVERHLDQKLPNATVLGDFMKGMKFYDNKVEFTGNMTFEQITARREASIAAGLEKFGKVKRP